jgi:hypothetical protein
MEPGMIILQAHMYLPAPSTSVGNLLRISFSVFRTSSRGDTYDASCTPGRDSTCSNNNNDQHRIHQSSIIAFISAVWQ